MEELLFPFMSHYVYGEVEIFEVMLAVAAIHTQCRTGTYPR